MHYLLIRLKPNLGLTDAPDHELWLIFMYHTAAAMQ